MEEADCRLPPSLGRGDSRDWPNVPIAFVVGPTFAIEYQGRL